MLDAEAGTAATSGTLSENAARAGKAPAAIVVATRAVRMRFTIKLSSKQPSF
jgi:hypothetical protein